MKPFELNVDKMSNFGLPFKLVVKLKMVYRISWIFVHLGTNNKGGRNLSNGTATRAQSL
jgi:hypothetical protein